MNKKMYHACLALLIRHDLMGKDLTKLIAEHQ